MVFSKARRPPPSRETLLAPKDLAVVSFSKPIRDKQNHSSVGILQLDGQDYFVKKYPPESKHFASEVAVLDMLAASAKVNFFVDYIGKNEDTRTLAFPVLDEDASRYAQRVTLKHEDVLALCDLIEFELEQFQNLSTNGFVLRADDPFFFLRRLLDKGILRKEGIITDLDRLSRNSLLFRYDPQLDNFMLRGGELFSIDFSMIRIVHRCYPFAYIVHNLYEHPRPNVDVEFVESAIENYLGQSPQTYLVEGLPAKQMLLLNRAESLAHSVDWNLRRDLLAEAAEKHRRLERVLHALRV